MSFVVGNSCAPWQVSRTPGLTSQLEVQGAEIQRLRAALERVTRERDEAMGKMNIVSNDVRTEAKRDENAKVSNLKKYFAMQITKQRICKLASTYC